MDLYIGLIIKNNTLGLSTQDISGLHTRVCQKPILVSYCSCQRGSVHNPTRLQPQTASSSDIYNPGSDRHMLGKHF